LGLTCGYIVRGQAHELAKQQVVIDLRS
jgi:hypothetical protein